MNTYSLKVDTQNLSKSFIYYENDNLNFDRNRAIKVTKMYLIKNN